MRGGFVNKNKQALYFSGLISEEQLAETSDFEYSMALAQKMRNDFETLAGSLEECLQSCMALEKQMKDSYAFHEKSGMDRVDSQGVSDADYFEDALENISGLAKSLRVINQLSTIDQSFDALINRLSVDI